MVSTFVSLVKFLFFFFEGGGGLNIKYSKKKYQSCTLFHNVLKKTPFFKNQNDVETVCLRNANIDLNFYDYTSFL